MNVNSIVCGSTSTTTSSAAPGPALVRRGQRVDQDVQQRVLRQTLLLGEQADRFGHVEIAHDDCSFLRFAPGSGPWPGFGAGPHSKTVLARSIWS